MDQEKINGLIRYLVDNGVPYNLKKEKVQWM